LRSTGKLAMGGPTENDPDIAEVLVFNRIGDEEARRLMADDPAVKASVLRVDFHRWWCAENVIPKP
jgi:hypothetical protein